MLLKLPTSNDSFISRNRGTCHLLESKRKMKDAAKSPVALDALPKPWLYFWRLEILVVLGSVCYWAFGYKSYLNGIFGAHTEGIDREYFLLLQGAITIFCCYVYVLFYARCAMLKLNY